MFQANLKRRESGRGTIVKLLTSKVVLVAVVLGVSLAPRTCEAAEHDLRKGKFVGNWCGYDASFTIVKQNGWKFEGTIFIKATGQTDRIKIEQFDDNHLRIVRSLSGEQTGRTQTVVTYPPETITHNGATYVNFKVKSASGYGSKPLGHLHMPK